MQAASREVEKQFPSGVDVLINNAGILSDHVTHLNMCAWATLPLESVNESLVAGLHIVSRECDAVMYRRSMLMLPFLNARVCDAEATLTLQRGERFA